MMEKKFNAVHLLIMGFTLTVAAVLRLVGIHFGLPQAFHTDETILVYATRQFFQGDFNPHNFYYPSLIMYIMHLVQRIVFIFYNGEFSTSTLFLICRITVAAFGLAAIIVTYRMGLKLFNRTVALLSALVMTLLPLHVINSHLATTDVPLTFFILLTLSSMFILVDKGSWKSYLLCGVLFGLTVSTKIPGAVIFLPILIAHFYRVRLETGLKYGALLRRLSSHQWIISGAVGLVGGLAVFAVLHHFQSIVQWINSTFAVDVWLDHSQRIVAAVMPQRLKFAAIAFFTLFAFLITSPIWRLHLNKLLLLIGASLAAFFMTTPYALLDYKAFIKDFLHQMVVSQTTWGGMFYQAPPGVITNFNYLYHEFGWILFIFFFAGMALLLRKTSIHRILLLSVLWVYFLYISSWKILFDRYMTPILPLMSLITLYGLDTALGGLLKSLKLKPAKKRSLHTILCALVLVLPLGTMLYKSVDYDRYLLKKSTRTLAYEWGVENLPREAKILIENYSPQFDIAGLDILHVHADFNRLVDSTYVRANKVDYLVVTSKMWERKIPVDGTLVSPVAYDSISTYADLIRLFEPSKDHPGPIIKVYRVKPLNIAVANDGQNGNADRTADGQSKASTSQ